MPFAVRCTLLQLHLRLDSPAARSRLPVPQLGALANLTNFTFLIFFYNPGFSRKCLREKPGLIHQGEIETILGLSQANFLYEKKKRLIMEKGQHTAKVESFEMFEILILAIVAQVLFQPLNNNVF